MRDRRRRAAPADLGQVRGDEHRPAERDAAARDRGLDHGGRVVDLQAPLAVDLQMAGVLQPRAPCRKGALQGHRPVVDQRMMAQVSGTAQRMRAAEQRRCADRKERVPQQERRLEPRPTAAAVADAEIDAIGNEIDQPSAGIDAQVVGRMSRPEFIYPRQQPLPMMHVGELATLLGCVRFGRPMILFDRFDADALLDTIEPHVSAGPDFGSKDLPRWLRRPMYSCTARRYPPACSSPKASSHVAMDEPVHGRVGLACSRSCLICRCTHRLLIKLIEKPKLSNRSWCV
jgi:hypothetical protein